jgi:hypothetical protein
MASGTCHAHSILVKLDQFFFIKKGHRQFTTPLSRLILTAAMITSILQVGQAIYLLLTYG